MRKHFAGRLTREKGALEPQPGRRKALEARQGELCFECKEIGGKQELVADWLCR